MVQNALKFLLHPSVAGQARDRQAVFLLRKGLTQAEVREAFRAAEAQRAQNAGQGDSKVASAGQPVAAAKEGGKGKGVSSTSIFSAIRQALGRIVGVGDDAAEDKVESVGNLTLSELSAFDGGSCERLIVSVEGVLYDITQRWDLYGPGKKYNVFCGRDATFALATMSLEKADMNRFSFELDGEQEQTLREWVAKYKKSYPVVGRLKLESAAESDEKGAANQDAAGKDATDEVAVGGETSSNGDSKQVDRDTAEG